MLLTRTYKKRWRPMYPIKQLLLLPLLCCGMVIQAQQLPLFTQYRYQHGLINPASVNIDYTELGFNLSYGAAIRSQWAAQSGTPQTQTVHGEFIFNENFITAGYILNDQTGPTSMTGIYGRLGYIISDRPAERGIAGGFNFGMVNHRVRVTEVTLENPNADVLGQTDQSQWFPDLGVGIYAYQTIGRNNHIIYGGLSIPQVLGLDLTFREFDADFNLLLQPHFYGRAGMYLTINESNFLEPSVWVKYTNGAPLQADFNLRSQFYIDNSYMGFWLGGGISTAGNFSLDFGLNLPTGDLSEARIGYGFGQGWLNTYGAFFGSSHEINFMMTLETE